MDRPGGDQSRLKLFTYVHRVPWGENMGGNIPTYFLIQPEGIISRQTFSQEERASNWVNNPYSPSHNSFGNSFIRVAQRKEHYSRLSATTSIFKIFFFPNPNLNIFHLHTKFHIDTNQTQCPLNYLYISQIKRPHTHPWAHGSGRGLGSVIEIMSIIFHPTVFINFLL